MHAKRGLSVFFFVSGVFSAALSSTTKACAADNCARAVTGTSPANIPLASRKADCSKALTSTVTPAVVTATSTVTKTLPISTTVTALTTSTSQVTTTVIVTTTVAALNKRGHVDGEVKNIDRRTVTSTSTGIPTYASACSSAVRYSSACSCFGFTATTVTAATPTTTTTVTVTTGSTVTITASTSTTVTPSTIYTTVTSTTTTTAPTTTPTGTTSTTAPATRPAGTTSTTPSTTTTDTVSTTSTTSSATPTPSSVFPCGPLQENVQAMIQILDAGTMAVLGYLSNNENDSDGIMYNLDTQANALVVALTYTSTDCSAVSNLALVMQNFQDDPSGGKYLGLIGGSGGYDMKPGSIGYAYTGQTDYVAPNSEPQYVITGAWVNTDYDGPAEASIWNLDLMSASLTATWTNSDSTTDVTTMWLDYGICTSGCLFQGGDLNAFDNKYMDSTQQVLLRLIPTV